MFEQAVLESSYGNRRAFATGDRIRRTGRAGCMHRNCAHGLSPSPAEAAAHHDGHAPDADSARSGGEAARETECHAIHSPGDYDSNTHARATATLQRSGGGGRAACHWRHGRNLDSNAGPPGRNLEPCREHAQAAGRHAQAKAPVEEVKRIAVSTLDPGRLIHMVEPVYPPIAKTVHISGTVELQAVIGTDGRVRELNVISGPALLRQAAIEAVKQWVYKPPVLNGAKVELIAPIAVIFRLN